MTLRTLNLIAFALSALLLAPALWLIHVWPAHTLPGHFTAIFLLILSALLFLACTLITILRFLLRRLFRSIAKDARSLRHDLRYMLRMKP